MKNIWKVLFFILLVIVLVVILGGYLNLRTFAYGNWYFDNPMNYPFSDRNFDYQDRFDMRSGTYFNNPSMGMPLMTMPFILFGMGTKFLPLVLLGLIVWGIYRLGVANGRNQVITTKTQATTDQPAQTAPPEQEVEIK